MFILTNEVFCSYQDYRRATPYDTRQEAVTAGQETIALEIYDGDDIQKDYEEKDNDIGNDQVKFSETGSFLFEGFSSRVEIRIIEVEDFNAFIEGFEK